MCGCQLNEEIAQIRDNIRDKLIPKTDEQFVIKKDTNQSKIKKKFAEKNIEDTELIKNNKKKENLDKNFLNTTNQKKFKMKSLHSCNQN